MYFDNNTLKGGEMVLKLKERGCLKWTLEKLQHSECNTLPPPQYTPIKYKNICILIFLWIIKILIIILSKILEILHSFLHIRGIFFFF
jgi:hypothetical protein